LHRPMPFHGTAHAGPEVYLRLPAQDSTRSINTQAALLNFTCALLGLNRLHRSAAKSFTYNLEDLTRRNFLSGSNVDDRIIAQMQCGSICFDDVTHKDVIAGCSSVACSN
jgi:hypothetical protein